MFRYLIFFPKQGYVAILRCNMLKDQANLLTSDLEYILYNCHSFTSKSPFLLVLKRFFSHVEHFKHWHGLFLLSTDRLWMPSPGLMVLSFLPSSGDSATTHSPLLFCNFVNRHSYLLKRPIQLFGRCLLELP